jgi:CelD/BcsL family acetyltransferase involved in cellulose biosynthesis
VIREGADPAMPDKMTVSVVDTDEGFRALQPQWQNLVEHDRTATIFQTWTFQYFTWRIFAERVRLQILLVRDDAGELLGCAPLGIQQRKIGPVTVRILGFACIKYSDYSGFVVRDGRESEVLPAVADWIGRNRGLWDVVLFKPVREDFRMLAFPELFLARLPKTAQKEQFTTAPYLAFDGSWQSYQDALSGKRAKAVRYEVRNLFRHFDGDYAGVKKGQELMTALDDLMVLHQKRIREKYQLGAFADETVRTRFRDLVSALSEEGRVEIHTIRSEERTIAAIGTFVFRSVVSYFQGGFDPEFNRFSPGKVIQALRITESIEKGAELFDFLCGDESYKSMWSNGRWPVYAITVKTRGWRSALYRISRALENRVLSSQKARALYFRLHPGEAAE